MKPFVSIVFSFLFLLQAVMPGMDMCCELQKLPGLVEHFQEHETLEGISFWSFLKLHYGSGLAAGEGHHQDEHDSKLPFHGQHQCSHGYVFITPGFMPLAVAPFPVTTQTRISTYSFFHASEHSDSLFQPPRA